MKLMRVFVFIVLVFLFSVNYSQADSPSCNFIRPLTIGSKGTDVICLQLYLQAGGFFVYEGGITGYFGAVTRASVAKWQANNGVAPTLGYFGSLSRAKYQEIISAKIQKRSGETLSFSLPVVSNDEIIVDSAGVSTTDDYIKKFLIDTSSASVLSFDGRKLGSVVKDENKIPLFIPDLAQRVIDSGMSQEIKDSLSVNEELINAKLDYLKSMRVSGEAVDLHKKMIGFDRLTLQLAQKISDFGDGKISKTDLKNSFDQYKNLAESEKGKLLKKMGLVAEKPNLFEKLIAWPGFGDQFHALAVALPFTFGGKVQTITPCLCNGFLVSIGPPKPADSLFVSYYILISPLFYLYKLMYPGVWWLGLYLPIPISCLNPVCYGACCPTGTGNLMIMTGTSL